MILKVGFALIAAGVILQIVMKFIPTVRSVLRKNVFDKVQEDSILVDLIDSRIDKAFAERDAKKEKK